MLSSVVVKPFTVTGKEDVQILTIPESARTPRGAAAKMDRACRGVIKDQMGRGRFKGKLGETRLVVAGSRHILLVGIGKPAKLDSERSAEAGGAAARTLSNAGYKSAALLLGDELRLSEPSWFVEAFVKGCALATYSFSLNASPPPAPSLRKLTVFTDAARQPVTQAARRGLAVSEYAAIVRDFVNAPANTMTPTILAKEARALCREHGVHCRVLGEKEIQKEKMGAILSVARGSREEPKLIVMHYNRDKKDLPMVCLVGKGVTFDSGGISIKPWDRMNEMKGDMAGAAVVIASVAAAASQKLPLQIVGVVPAVENMPDGTALKPGDVIETYSGKTIEVLTTDAEGRLILADALTFVRKNYAPEVTVDYATLTGAVLIALGTQIAGVMGNSQRHIDALLAAGSSAGEPVWQLPLDDRFYESVSGDITDYKNYSGRNASSITAAALLGKFAGDSPWVHVDIAGTFWNDGSGPAFQTKGATGYGVDLTLRFLEALSEG